MLFEHSMVKPTKVGNGEQIFGIFYTLRLIT